MWRGYKEHETFILFHQVSAFEVKYMGDLADATYTKRRKTEHKSIEQIHIQTETHM